MMAHLAIETRNLGRVFTPRVRFFGSRQGSEATALDDLSIHVSFGERVALVGPNGAGKSTLLRILATLLAPTSGVASVAGYDVEVDRRHVRASLGLMSGDDRSFFWPLTALENLTFFASLYGRHGRSAERRCRKLLDEVHLDPDDGRPVSAYSSGMRQRLGLARALLHDPPVLLLDEPTANLDAESRGRLVETILNQSELSNLTVLFATHDVALVDALSHRTIHLAGGALAEPAYHRSARRYRLIARTPNGPAGQDLETTKDSGGEVTVDDLGDGHALGTAIQQILANGGEILSVETDSQTEVES